MQFKAYLNEVDDYFPGNELKVEFKFGDAQTMEDIRHELVNLMLKGKRVAVTIEAMS